MLLALIACHLSVLVAANPFHRYPFVFLLDVGNEELEKTNTEQIRLSMPGGSLALRYPAIGDGDTIGHVRVSGIDFGTDLKANIIDGGPGYKYVVFVLMGNPRVPYNAVITIQTVKDDSFYDKQINISNTNSYSDTRSEVDNNNSAEDSNSDELDNGSSQIQKYIESNSELMQSSSNMYKYAQSEVNEENDDKNDLGGEVIDDEQIDTFPQAYEVSEDNDEDKDIHIQNYENSSKDDRDVEVKDISYNDDESDDVEIYSNESENDGINSNSYKTSANELNIKAEKFSSDYRANSEPIIVDDNLYSKYEALKPHLYDAEVYSQDDVPQNMPVFPQDQFDYEDSGGIEQVFNDIEVYDDAGKFKDFNNNDYVDSDDGSAVAY